MKRIVVGIDDDAQADAVLDWVARYAEENNAHVVLVHAVLRRALWLIAGVQVDSTTYLNDCEEQFERIAVAPLRRRGISVELRVPIGYPEKVLAETATREGAEFIVVGGPHHGTLHDVVVGSTVCKLEHCTDVPVVVMPPVRPHIDTSA
jgi:nucleotide-binding universal stress UspA family protein